MPAGAALDPSIAEPPAAAVTRATGDRLILSLLILSGTASPSTKLRMRPFRKDEG
jgi:hypothetical protein